MHKIAKFNGKDGHVPKLNKLGSKAWKALKQKTKTRVKAIAFDLIKLYAKRREKIGHAFPTDSYLQLELEASFMFEDTPDQSKTTAAVKADMENERPMDRLVLGGVCLRKPTDFSQTRGFVPMSARQSVHGMPVIAGSIELARRYRTSYQRPPGSVVSSQEMYPSAKILAFAVQAHAEPRGDGVTAAFRSKTRRLLALPRPWRKHAPHFRARRPQWPPIPSWFVHSVKGARE